RALIARRRDDEDAGRPEPLDREVEHALPVRGGHGFPEGEVDDADVEAVRVGEDPAERGDDVARAGTAWPVDVQRVDRRAGSDSDVAAVLAPTRGHSGDQGAVADGVLQ